MRPSPCVCLLEVLKVATGLFAVRYNTIVPQLNRRMLFHCEYHNMLKYVWNIAFETLKARFEHVETYLKHIWKMMKPAFVLCPLIPRPCRSSPTKPRSGKRPWEKTNLNSRCQERRKNITKKTTNPLKITFLQWFKNNWILLAYIGFLHCI